MAKPDAPKQSFDDFIQEGRRKRKAEQLAQEIFGKNRRTSAPGSERSTPPAGGSLASRVGVNKRSTSTSSLNRNSFAARVNQPSKLSQSTIRAVEKAERAVEQAIRPTARQTNNLLHNGSTVPEMSIRGAAGPYLVVAQNFAPGTTAADIESVMMPVGGEMLACRLVAATPTVIAEMTFAAKEGAENVIATFNNKKADGRLLYVYLKDNGASVGVRQTGGARARASQVTYQPPAQQQQQQVEVQDDVVMDVDEAPVDEGKDLMREERSRHGFAREERDQRSYRDDGYDRGGRRSEQAAPPPQDSRYGFEGQGAQRNGYDAPRGPRYPGRDGGRRGDRRGGYREQGRMYSDDLMGRRY